MVLKNLLSPHPLYLDTALGIVRIFLGSFMIYHGWEVFDDTKMNEYAKWMLDLKLPAPSFMAYMGKSVELGTGILIVLGFFTRIAFILLGITMIFICFFIGKGRIFMEEQHPFLFVLLSFLFFFSGPGRWSMDKLLFHSQKQRDHMRTFRFSRIKKFLLTILLSVLIDAVMAQQPACCKPINLDYGYTPIPNFSKWKKHCATTDPVVVTYKEDYFLFSTKQWGYWWRSDMMNWNFVLFPYRIHQIK